MSKPFPIRLLVIDDNLLQRAALNRRLQRSGFEAMTVIDADEAIRVIDDDGFELALIDMSSGANGLDILRRLRQSLTSMQLPVILINGRGDEREAELALEAGANDYVQGSCDYDSLLARITALFASASELDPNDMTHESIRPRHGPGLHMAESVPGSPLDPDPASADSMPTESALTDSSSSGSSFGFVLQETQSKPSDSLDVMNLAESSVINEAKAAPSDVFPPGTQLGNYTIVRILGRGAMGVVYEASNDVMDRNVALKTLSHQYAFDHTRMDLIRAEARLAARVEHANVVGVYEMGNWKGTYFVAMQLVRGSSLQSVLEAQGPLCPAEATRILIDACQGLAAVHDCKLIHRDIKPANIMIGRDGAAKLTDFGLAQAKPLIEPQPISDSGSINPAQVVGTPHFMSPEQCRALPVTVRSDIYSMGATYYKLLTGLFPYNGARTISAVLSLHIHAPVPDPRKINASIPEACAKVIAKSMAKLHADRYQDSREMIAALRQVSREL